MKYAFLIMVFLPFISYSQSNLENVIKIKDGLQIQFILLKNEGETTKILTLDSTELIVPTYLIDSTKPISLSNDIPLTPTQNNTTSESKQKHYSISAVFGLSLGNFIELYNPSGSNDKLSFSFNGNLDFTYSLKNPNSICNTSHELHYSLGIQKEKIDPGNHLQRAQDMINTLHDFSVAFTKKKKWQVNLIARASSSLFTIFDGDYFADYNALGKINAPLSPLNLTLSPGIKYQFSEPLRVSISPYSSDFTAVFNSEIRNKGIFILEQDVSGNYKNLILKKQGIEANIWYDKRVKEWLEMQYRFSFGSDYKGGIFQNGIIDGLFITRIRLIKNIYFTHRASIYNTLQNDLLKPYFTQNIQLSYSQNF